MSEEKHDPVLEALRKYNENLTDEDLKKIQEKIKQNNKREERYINYINYIHNMSPDERYKFIDACISKYTSDEYLNKEYAKGYEPRCPLYDVILQYGVRYGIPTQYKENDWFPEEQYDIDGKFIVSALHGQGTLIDILRVNDDEIIPHILEEYPITVYNNKDEKICETSSTVTYLDILIQLRTKKLSGYYVVYKKKRYNIDPVHYKVMDRNFTFGKIHGDLLNQFVLGK